MLIGLSSAHRGAVGNLWQARRQSSSRFTPRPEPTDQVPFFLCVERTHLLATTNDGAPIEAPVSKWLFLAASGHQTTTQPHAANFSHQSCDINTGLSLSSRRDYAGWRNGEAAIDSNAEVRFLIELTILSPFRLGRLRPVPQGELRGAS